MNGETCIEIPRAGGAFSTPKRYCQACYGSILEQTAQDLDELKSL